MLATIANFLKSVLYTAVFIASWMIIFTPDPSMHRVGILVGLIGILVTLNTDGINGIKLAESLRKDLKLVQLQDMILNEVKKNNTEVINLVMSQADLLSKMTTIAMSKPEKEAFPNES